MSALPHSRSAAEAETSPPALASTEQPTLPPGEPPSLPPIDATAAAPPGYEILGELGRGGMGVVYQARHLALDRIVALKMVLSGGHAGEADRRRFRAEAQAVARLRHPNIVAIHEFGEQGGLPYFSMEFCPGGSLAGRLARESLTPRESAALVRDLADAMQAAHDKGIVHRDLKPANVLIDDRGTARITDFGLARLCDVEGQTQSGVVMGTPSYMAPEQAAGRSKDVGPAADVYALGAILYECLAGRPPFQGNSSLDTILQVISDEPAPPSRLRQRVPRDLETIALQCLRKDPRRRYASAADLAADLDRYLDGRPVQARPVGPLTRVGKWMRRHPALTALGVLSVLVVVGLVTLALEVLAAFTRIHAGGAVAVRKSAALAVSGDGELAVAAPGGSIGRRELLSGRELPAWAGHSLHVTALAYSGDGRWLASGGKDKIVCLWDRRHGRARHTLHGHTAEVTAVAFSPDGRHVASAADDRTVRVWDVETGACALPFRGHRAKVHCLTFSADGRLASGNGRKGEEVFRGMATGTVLVWRAGQEEPQLRLKHRGPVWGVAFSPDGKTIASVSADRTLALWDAGSGQLRHSRALPCDVHAVAFSPDGARLAVACDDAVVNVYSAGDLALGQELRGHFDAVVGLAFEPRGGPLVSLAGDGGVILWDPVKGGRWGGAP